MLMDGIGFWLAGGLTGYGIAIQWRMTVILAAGVPMSIMA